MAFLSPSPMEMMVIAVIALIVLGPSRLPEAARSLGRGMREMRDSFQGGSDDEDEDGGSDRHDPYDEPDGPDGDGIDDPTLDDPGDGRHEDRERVGSAPRSS